MFKLLVAVGVALVVFVAYKLRKAGKAVTGASVIAAVKTDVTTAVDTTKTDVKTAVDTVKTDFTSKP